MLNKFTKLLYGPHQVSFDITNKCNLRCLHCFNNSGENDLINDELSDDEVRDFIKSLVSLKLYSFCFCGGETLLRKDLLLECTKMLKSNGTTRCSMVTNGILATPSVLDEVSQVGMDAVQFSLDGLKCSHDRLRNSEGVFDSVIAAITYLLNNTNVHVAIAYTPTEFNINEFSEFYDFLLSIWKSRKRQIKNDYLELRLQPLMLLGRAKQNLKIQPSAKQYRALVYDIHRIESMQLEHGIHVTWGDPIDHILRFRDTSNLLDQTSIHSNGDIVVSPYLPLVVGNIRKYSLKEYWDHGLNAVWSRNIVQYLTSSMQSIHDMETVTNTISDVNMSGGLYIDLIESDLDDLNLIKEVIIERI